MNVGQRYLYFWIVSSLTFLFLSCTAAPLSARSQYQLPYVSHSGERVAFRDPRAKIYAVGPHIPGIDVEAPPSYAGLMPVDEGYDLSEKNLRHLRHENYENGTRALYFWLWLADEKAPNFRDLVIWLTGGPGCSSIAYGMFEETGPIELLNRTNGPRLRRLTSWTTRANVLYVDQPINTGFSTGRTSPADEFAASSEFYHFLNNLFDVFPEVIVDDDQYLYLVGESYGGLFAPYRATQLLSSYNTWGLAGMLLINGVMGNFIASSSLTTWDFVKANNKDYLHLPDASLQTIKNASDTCNLTDYYPNNVRFPQVSPMEPYDRDDSCQTWGHYLDLAQKENPNFNVYDISWQDRNHSYFNQTYFGDPNQVQNKNPINRDDVRQYIHAPVGKPFAGCTIEEIYPNGMSLVSPGESILPWVVERLNRTIVATSNYDSIIMSNGTFLILQNMTWSGQLGFHEPPTAHPFFDVEGHETGTYTQRDKLAYVRVMGSGHEIPKDDPESGLALLDVLLGNRHLDGSKGKW